MINKRIKLLVALLSLTCQGLKAQIKIDSVKKYVVFTFEITHKKSKINEHYYWIAPQDSIAKKNAFEVFPLYTEEYSKDVLERCKKGGHIDIFTASTASNFNFDDDYKLELKNLHTLINTYKIKIQEIRKMWLQGAEEIDIKVYATPINGEFCNCLQSHGNKQYDFSGLIYLPVMSFSYDQSFWNIKTQNIIKFVDYSYVAYSSHYPSSMHGNSDIRVKSSIEVFK